MPPACSKFPAPTPAPSAPPPSALTRKQKLCYAAGVLLDQPGLHAVNALAHPIYNVHFGINPAHIGFALAAFRIVEALTDPIIGWLTDRFESRWGRRRPFLFLGAILSAFLFPLIWFAPTTWTAGAILTYFVVLSILYFTSHSLYSIPFLAFGFELSPDFDERNKLFVWRNWFGLLGFLGIAWLYPLAQCNWFPNPVIGVRWVTVGVGVIILLTALVPALTLRERFSAKAKQNQGSGILRSITDTLRNRVYLRLAMAMVSVVLGSNMVGILGFYLTVYYLYGGDPKAAAVLVGVGGSAGTLVALVALPLVPRLMQRLDKKTGVLTCLVVQLLGSALKWVCYDPRSPYLSLIPLILVSVGNYIFWMLAASMIADVCDFDESRTGRRREGMFASVTQWLNKIGYSGASAVSGLLLVWIGFDVSLSGAQSASTLFWMRLLYVVVPAASFVAALFLLRAYPLTRERVHAIRREIEFRRVNG